MTGVQTNSPFEQIWPDAPPLRAAAFDIDGTLSRGADPWLPLRHSPDVALWRKARLYAEVVPHMLVMRAGLADQAGFRDRWVRHMAALMTGWPSAQVQALCHRIVHEILIPDLRADVVEILRAHQQHGHRVVLVSTMFDAIVGELAAALGADAGLGSTIAYENGRCLGRVVGETCAGARKVTALNSYLAALDPPATLSECAAYADSRSDIAFLSGVGWPVAVYPDAEMRAAARERNWRTYPAT